PTPPLFPYTRSSDLAPGLPPGEARPAMTVLSFHVEFSILTVPFRLKSPAPKPLPPDPPRPGWSFSRLPLPPRAALPTKLLPAIRSEEHTSALQSRRE